MRPALSEQPTVVLVHGAFTDASVWHPVIERLQHQGHRVIAPALPMRSLAGDSAALRAVLAALDGPVVVAGHSWGGSVISELAALTPAVRALVFIAAFAQDSGETAAELNYRYPGSRLVPDTTVVRPAPDGSEMMLRPEHFAPVYAADVAPATAAVMASAQKGINPDALGQAFTGSAAWRAMPSWTLIATDDQSLPPDAQRWMARRAGSASTEIASAHAVPVAHPRQTADVIVTAVNWVTAQAAAG